MKASLKAIDSFFDFDGIWGLPSKCGLKIIRKEDKNVVIVTELYQDNPGTSVTQAVCTLAKQICTRCQIPMNNMIYLEHNPDMNSKLSFYDEEYFLVNFDIANDTFKNPKWTKLDPKEVEEMFKI